MCTHEPHTIDAWVEAPGQSCLSPFVELFLCNSNGTLSTGNASSRWRWSRGTNGRSCCNIGSADGANSHWCDNCRSSRDLDLSSSTNSRPSRAHHRCRSSWLASKICISLASSRSYGRQCSCRCIRVSFSGTIIRKANSKNMFLELEITGWLEDDVSMAWLL